MIKDFLYSCAIPIDFSGEIHVGDIVASNYLNRRRLYSVKEIYFGFTKWIVRSNTSISLEKEITTKIERLQLNEEQKNLLREISIFVHENKIYSNILYRVVDNKNESRLQQRLRKVDITFEQFINAGEIIDYPKEIVKKIFPNLKDFSNLTGESWFPIKDYENLYKVSNFGRVKSIKYYGNNYEDTLSEFSPIGLYRDGKRTFFNIESLMKKNIPSRPFFVRYFVCAYLTNTPVNFPFFGDFDLAKSYIYLKNKKFYLNQELILKNEFQCKCNNTFQYNAHIVLKSNSIPIQFSGSIQIVGPFRKTNNHKKTQ